MSDLLTAYPALGEAIARLSGGRAWRFTGASALLFDATHLYLEITKPNHWRRRDDGTLVAGIGAIGGSLEPGEDLLPCVRREAAEEVGAPVELLPADETHLVYEERTIETLRLGAGDLPAPVLCTVSRNLYRRRALPDADVLAIATFWATLAGAPRLGDLFGLLALPWDALGAALAVPHPTVGGVRSLPRVRLETSGPIDAGALLAPVWTVRSLQLLMQAGCLRLPPSGPVPSP